MVIFNPYAVGPYAMGSVTVPLPYSAYASYLNQDYTMPETTSAGNGELTEETVTKIRTSRLEGGAQVNHGDLNVYMDQKNEFGGGTLNH